MRTKSSGSSSRRVPFDSGLRPNLADHRKHDVAFGDTLIEHVHEIETGRDIIDVDEKLLARERILQPIKQATGIAGIVSAAVVDENLASHSRHA